MGGNLLLLGGLGSGLGDLAGALLLGDTLDDTDSDGLTHVTDGEATEGLVVLEGLDAKGLSGFQADNGSITRLDKLGLLLDGLTRTTINLLFDTGELAGNVSSVAIQHGGVSRADLSRVVKHDDLGGEAFASGGGVVLGVTSNVTTTDVLDGDVLDVESDVVSGEGLLQLLVVHLDGLDLSGEHGGGKGDDHTGLQDTGLDTPHGHCANTSNLVDILEGDTEGLLAGTLGGDDGVEGLEKSGSLPPAHVGGALQHVVTVPPGDGDEGDLGGVEPDLLQETGDLVLDLSVTVLGVVDRLVVHLVDGANHLLDSKGEGKEGVLTGLTVLGDTSLKLTSTRGNDEDGNIGLGSTSDHVLDEITVTRGIDDGEVELGGLKLPESDIDGDTSLTLGLELVQHPRVLEGTLTHIGGFLLELLDGTLVDSTALVDQVTSGGGLTGIDMTDDNDVNVSLFLSHD